MRRRTVSFGVSTANFNSSMRLRSWECESGDALCSFAAAWRIRSTSARRSDFGDGADDDAGGKVGKGVSTEFGMDTAVAVIFTR